MKRLQAIAVVFVVCFVLAGLLTWLITSRPAARVTPTPTAAIASVLEPTTETAETAPISSTALISAEIAAAPVLTSTNAVVSVAGAASVSVTPEDDPVNVRGGPGTQYEVVGRLGNTDTAAVIGRNAAGDWLQIQQGWVNAEVVLITGDIGTLPVLDGDKSNNENQTTTP